MCVGRVCGVEWDQQVVLFQTLPNIQFELQIIMEGKLHGRIIT